MFKKLLTTLILSIIKCIKKFAWSNYFEKKALPISIISFLIGFSYLSILFFLYSYGRYILLILKNHLFGKKNHSFFFFLLCGGVFLSFFFLYFFCSYFVFIFFFFSLYFFFFFFFSFFSFFVGHLIY